MKNLILLILFLSTLTASAAQRITATITVTNRAVTGSTLTVNSSTRYWTNANSSGTILTNLVGKNETATNLYNQIASYPYSGPITLRYSTTNVILLTAQLDGALAVSVAGTWATVSLSTQSGPQTYTALWPLENMVGATNRTNQGSSFVKGLSDYSTNAFATNATALSNHITKGASPQQQVASPMHFAGLVRAGAGVAITNGFTVNLTNINSVSTGHVNFGSAIRSEGSGGNSLQVGSNALAVGSLSIAIGNGAVASNTTAFAVGIAALATNSYAMALGNGAIAGGTDALAIGRSATAYGAGAQAVGQAAIAQGSGALALQSEVTGNNSVGIGASSSVAATNATAVGTGSTVNYNDSSAFGKSATATTTNQIRLGTSSDTISAPGIYDSPTMTNGTFRGTNIFNSQVVFTPTANTGLANGYNAAVAIGAAYVRFSGPSAAYTNAGFSAANKMDGKMHFLQFDNPGLSMTFLHDSGLDPGNSTNRIYTGTGALVNSTNRVVHVIMSYDDAATAWRIWSFR
jgi:hypothetical protein